MQIAVTYECNVIPINCSSPVDGITAHDLLSLVCVKMNMKEKKVFLTCYGLGVSEDTIIYPGDCVAIHKHKRASEPNPNFGAQLWHLTKNARQEESLASIARDIRIEMVVELQYSARYGFNSCLSDPKQTQGWQRVMRYFPDHTDSVLKRVRILFRELDGLDATEDWLFTWENGHQIVPLITARDLNDMHVNLREQNRYRKVLVALRAAIINGEVAKDSRALQLDWARNFILLHGW